MIFQFIFVINFALRHDNFSLFIHKGYCLIRDATVEIMLLVKLIIVVVMRCRSVVKPEVKRRSIDIVETAIQNCSGIGAGRMRTVYVSYSEILLVET